MTNCYREKFGRTRLQTVPVIILAIVICAASVQILIESGERPLKDIRYFHGASSNKTSSDIDVTLFFIVAMVLTISVVISTCVLFAWSFHAYKYVRFLMGLAANHIVIQRIAHIVYNYPLDVITMINSVQAIHFDVNDFADVDIGMARSMSLVFTHDIEIDLQSQLETMDDIERALCTSRL
ncbi:unnamed protein product [Adineta ricciae]|uniref:Uncharacterized protein n=1 Tax=Adineta ricciae TaxID=249248 RepID=A0A814IJG0_ADIRI|nr:unnamed protein product [Adineta ricciae]